METDVFTNLDWILLGQRARAAAGALALVLPLIAWLGGLVPIIGSAILWASERSDAAGLFGGMAAFAGGVWCGFGWFGWPFVHTQVMTSPGGWFTSPAYETVDTFSVFALAGNIVCGGIGVVGMLILSAVIAPDLVGQLLEKLTADELNSPNPPDSSLVKTETTTPSKSSDVETNDAMIVANMIDGRLACPFCGKSLRAKETPSVRTVRCPSCSKSFCLK